MGTRAAQICLPHCDESQHHPMLSPFRLHPQYCGRQNKCRLQRLTAPLQHPRWWEQYHCRFFVTGNHLFHHISQQLIAVDRSINKVRFTCPLAGETHECIRSQNKQYREDQSQATPAAQAVLWVLHTQEIDQQNGGCSQNNAAKPVEGQWSIQ